MQGSVLVGLKSFFKLLFESNRNELENRVLELQEKLKAQEEAYSLCKKQEEEQKQKINKLENLAEGLRKKLVEAEESARKSMERLATAEIDQKHSQEAVQEANKKLVELQNKQNELQKEYSELQNKHDKLLNDYKAAQEQGLHLSEQNKELSKKCEELTGQNAGLAEQNKKLEEQNKNYETELALVKSTIPTMQSQLKELQKRNAQLERALEDFEQKIGIGTIIEATITKPIIKNGITAGHCLDYHGKEVYVPSLDPNEKLTGKVRCRIMEHQLKGYIVDNEVTLETGKQAYIKANRKDMMTKLLYAGCLNGILLVKHTEKEKKFEGIVEITSKTTRKIGGVTLDLYTGMPKTQRSKTK